MDLKIIVPWVFLAIVVVFLGLSITNGASKLPIVGPLVGIYHPERENGSAGPVLAAGIQPSFAAVGRNEEGITIVEYTNAGFTPFIVEVEAGEPVTFVNNSDKGLWVTASGHPTAQDQFYPEFDSVKTLSRGEEYVFVFLQPGVWGYKNLNNESHLGAVVVVPQQN